VLGILSVLLCGPIAAIPAVILGAKGRKAAAEGQANNQGMATAGLVIGWIVIGFAVVGLVLFTIAIVTAGGWHEYWSTVSSSSRSSRY